VAAMMKRSFIKAILKTINSSIGTIVSTTENKNEKRREHAAAPFVASFHCFSRLMLKTKQIRSNESQMKQKVLLQHISVHTTRTESNNLIEMLGDEYLAWMCVHVFLRKG
jgi:hypothetical protein